MFSCALRSHIPKNDWYVGAIQLHKTCLGRFECAGTWHIEIIHAS